MPYFSNHYRYYGYSSGERRPDASLTVKHNPDKTTTLIRESGARPLGHNGDIPQLFTMEENAKALAQVRKLRKKRKYRSGVPFSESGLTYDHKSGTFHVAKEDDQLQLFAHDPPKPSQVEMLVSRDNMGARITAMTLLGLADMDARARTGHPLQTSSDLSPHSLRLVRHLRDRGAVSNTDVPSTSTNTIGFEFAEATLDEAGNNLKDIQRPGSGYTDRSPDARSAREHIISMRRPAKETPKPQPTQTEQPTLWEGLGIQHLNRTQFQI